MSKPTCTVDECEREQWSRGWCGMHYQRQRMTGSLHLAPKPTTDALFWAKVDKSGECWLWTAHIMRTGYGQFCFTEGDRVRKECAHRVAYEFAVGPIPDGLHIDHLCRVRACVRPDHLEPVTQAENNRRANAIRWAS